MEYANLQGRIEKALETGVFDIPVVHFEATAMAVKGFHDVWMEVMEDSERYWRAYVEKHGTPDDIETRRAVEYYTQRWRRELKVVIDVDEALGKVK